MFRQALLIITLSAMLCGQTPSAVSLFSSPDPSVSKGLVSLSAKLTPESASGQVVFYDGSSVLGIGSVNGGQAKLTARLGGAGKRLLRAHYSGDRNYSPSDATILTTPLLRVGRETSRASAAAPVGPYLLSTIAGLGFPPTSMPARSAVLRTVGAVTSDAAGDVYFADLAAVYRLDPSGNLTRVAGTGAPGFAGDNGPAVNAQLSSAAGLALDTSGSLYISDQGNFRVRRVSQEGIITTVAGDGVCCTETAPAGVAVNVEVGEPEGVAVDNSGNLYIADGSSNSIRKVDKNGFISTIAGGGAAGYSGDNQPAAKAQLYLPVGLTLDADGDLFIGDVGNYCIRKISTNGIITTVAGNGTFGSPVDNVPATTAQIGSAFQVAVDPSGNIYIPDLVYNIIRKVSSNGIITTVAGNGTAVYNGDGVDPMQAAFQPGTVALDPSGNLFVGDIYNRRIREISTGIINTAAGGGPADAAAAPVAMLDSPQWMASDQFGNLYFSDPAANRVYAITPSGAVATVAGTGVPGFSGDNGAATAAQLNAPAGLAVDSNGALYIADSENNRVRMVSGGDITTVAGTGGVGLVDDGGSARSANLWEPLGLAIDSLGNLYIADSADQRIRKVSSGGIISTIAGTYIGGYSGDNGPGIEAQINSPQGIAVDGSGNVYFADGPNDRIRKIDQNGIITTFAGTGVTGYSGDGGPASAAELSGPHGLSVDPAGNIYIADTSNSVIRMVDTSGRITTIAGDNAQSYSNSPVVDGPALSTTLSGPYSAIVANTGHIYIADTIHQVLRVLTSELGPPSLSITCSHSGSFALNSTNEYTLTVSNSALGGLTSGTVTVTELVPDGLSISSMSGIGWDCAGNTCTTSLPNVSGAIYLPITVVVDVSSMAPSEVTNLVTVSGGGSALAAAQDFTVLTAPPTTVQTNPVGVQFSVDGITAQIAPETLNLSPGPHILAVPVSTSVTSGTQTAFTGWSDSGAASHIIEVTGTATTYTATFNIQYQLTTASFPEPGGTVSPATGAFFDAGSSVPLTATATAPYTFTSWSGAASGTANATTITMRAPQSVTANFAVPGFTCAITGDATASVADVQLIVNEALGAVAPANDMNRDAVVNVADVQKVIESAMGAGCLY